MLNNNPILPASIARISLVLALSALIAPTASAQVSATFSGGNSTAVVDAWHGMAGEGWGTAWDERQNTFDSTRTSTVTNTNPLITGSGNYLSAAQVATEGAQLWPQYSQKRGYTSYGSLDITTVHQISFLYRLDKYDTTSGQASIFDVNLINQAVPQNSTTTWAIQTWSSTDVWRLSQGDGFAGSGGTAFRIVNPLESSVNVFLGDVYQFDITVDPQNNRYQATITNLDYAANSRSTGTASYSSAWLDFVLQDEGVGGFLTYNSMIRHNAGNTIEYSIDNISIVPEPAAYGAMIAIAILAFTLIARRRRC